VTRGTRPKKPSSSRGFARGARGAWGLKTENRNFFLSFQDGNNYQKKKKTIFILFYFILRPRPRGCTVSMQTRVVSARTLGCIHADAPCSRGRELRPRGCTPVSARTRFLPHPRTVKTRPWVKPRPRGKCGRGRTSRRNGRPDRYFHPKTFVMTTLS
jgi:hypothetical protein